MHQTKVTTTEVIKVAKLASLTLRDNEPELFAQQFSDTLEVVNLLNEVDTTTVSSTYQVTGLQNVTRPDEVDASRVLPQSTALREAKNTHNGYFVVNRIIDTDLF